MPEISVIMSAYNAQYYIKETIESVLCQTFKSFEFIIINDGSTDKTEDIVKQFQDKRIIFISQENQGLSKSLNRCLNLSKGKYIARIDADDICYPERFEKQYKFMEGNPYYVVCGSYADVISEAGEFIFTYKDVPLSDSEIRNKITEKNCFLHSSTFYKREQALLIGGYYEPIRQYFEDYMFFFQLVKLGKALNIPEPLIKYRITPGSISNVRYNHKYKSLVEKVVIRGFITDKEKDYLYSLKKKKLTEKTRMSDYYLNIARYFLTYQSDMSKVKHYYTLSIKTNPLNPNIIIQSAYMLYIYILKKCNSTAN